MVTVIMKSLIFSASTLNGRAYGYMKAQWLSLNGYRKDSMDELIQNFAVQKLH